MELLLGSVYAALLTPTEPGGGLDEAAYAHHIEFLLEAGMDGVVVNGATGEYPLAGPSLFRQMASVARRHANGKFLAGIGAGDLRSTVALGRVAIEHGAQAVLLPGPYFFHYTQEDLHCFCQEVARELAIPILLYNIPQFTNGYETSTVQTLLRDTPNIVGIKDSSGSLDTLRALTGGGAGAWRAVGNDLVLAAARRENLMDGVISGVAGVLPEPVAHLARCDMAADQASFEAVAALLQEFLEHLQRFPTPWGLKCVSEFRGFGQARFPLPLSDYRQFQKASFASWFPAWWERAQSIVAASPVPQ